LRADLLLQLVLATILGGATGLEREIKGKPAGLRTNILICIGAGDVHRGSVTGVHTARRRRPGVGSVGRQG
jgi:uncharacterized membrane protein YhiD involved in acid resistance